MSKQTIFSAIALIGITIASYGSNHVKKESLNELISLDVSKISFKVEKKTEVASKTCYYYILDANDNVVGHVVMTGVPSDVSCGSASATKRALDIWNAAQ